MSESLSADFLRFAMQTSVLRFGEFTLKSGRISPYFFNSGLFNTGARLARLAGFYSDAIVASGVEFDMLYGPAYKGIPLVAAVAMALSQRHDLDLPYCFNRKEAKDHGEGGIIVGATPGGRVLIVDDVISAGTSTRESIEILGASGARAVAVAICLDRQERGQQGARSAIQEIEQDLGLDVISVATLGGLIDLLADLPDRNRELAEVRAYRARYGAE